MTTTTTGTFNLAPSDTINLLNTPAPFSFYAILEAAREIPVIVVLYVCIGLNLCTHLITMVLTVICVGNFGKGLKERVFNSKLDRYFDECLCRK